MSTKMLGHFEILEPLGAGGMGEVFRARDTKLNRLVAIKVLPRDMAEDPARRQRFQREAEAIAALNHPGIVTIHSVEEHDNTVFLVMELIHGHSLDHSIPPHGMKLSDLLKLAIPIAGALRAAHEKGVTHRDLKPTNIMVTEDGHPKILDFGLAKLLEPPSQELDVTVPVGDSITKEGMVMGTAAYMSPEQAEGLPLDARTDIFSLGIILYEMATGQRPFRGNTTISTISAILKDEPTPVHELNASLPRHLGRIIQHCLAKSPDRRIQTAQDVRNELEGLKTEIESGSLGLASERVPSANPGGADRKRVPVWMLAAAAAMAAVLLFTWKPWDRAAQEPAELAAVADPAAAKRTMIVVLPFENLGPPEDAYFAAGVTEEVTNRLARVADLGVISRTSARSVSDAGFSIGRIGQELGVEFVVEGTVRWRKTAGGEGTIRVSSKLVRVSDATAVWSDQYDQDMRDVFEIQSNIAETVAGELGITLAVSGERGEPPPTKSLEAYRLYLQANELTLLPEPGNVKESLQLLDRALELDPDFARCWAAKSYFEAYTYHEYTDRSEARLAKAREAVDRAYAIDPNLNMAHVALGYYYYWGYQDYDRALEALERVVPEESELDALSGKAFIWRRQGKFEKALVNQHKRVRLDPRNGGQFAELVTTYGMMGRYAEAIQLIDQRIAGTPDPHPLLFQGKAWFTYMMTGDAKAAREVVMNGPDPDDHDRPAYGNLLWLCADERYGDALAMLADIREPIDTQNVYWPRSLWAAVIAYETGDSTRVRIHAEEALSIMQAKAIELPEDARLRSGLGLTLALLGRYEEAEAEGLRSIELMPRNRDIIRHFERVLELAAIYIVVGKRSEALDQLEYLDTLPNDLRWHEFNNKPIYRQLRSEPRFQALRPGSV